MIRLCEHIEYDVFQVIREDIQNEKKTFLNEHRLFGGGVDPYPPVGLVLFFNK